MIAQLGIFDVVNFSQKAQIEPKIQFMCNFNQFCKKQKKKRWKDCPSLQRDYLVFFLKQINENKNQLFSFEDKRRKHTNCDKRFAEYHLAQYPQIANRNEQIRYYQKMAKSRFRTFKRFYENHKPNQRKDFADLLHNKAIILMNRQKDLQQGVDCKQLAQCLKIFEQNRTQKHLEQNYDNILKNTQNGAAPKIMLNYKSHQSGLSKNR